MRRTWYEETYARWYAMSREQQEAIKSPGAWLMKVASRICLDLLSSARARRESYVGEWIPEPLPDRTSGSTGGRGAPPTTRQTASPSTSRSTWPSSCSAPNALDLEATVGQRGNKCVQQGPATQRYSAGVRPHSAHLNNTHERRALTLQAGSSFGSVPNRTMTCRVPNSCLRRTAVTHRSLNPGGGRGGRPLRQRWSMAKSSCSLSIRPYLYGCEPDSIHRRPAASGRRIELSVLSA